MDGRKNCLLCDSSEDNELLYGDMRIILGVPTHNFCLELSYGLMQHRYGYDGGYSLDDIKSEKSRVMDCRCYICNELHANLQCSKRTCNRAFHLKCGVNAGCLSQFACFNESWCADHLPLKPGKEHQRDEKCVICLEDMGNFGLLSSIPAACCENGWFHKHCAAQYALSAGEYFKCPLCNNVNLCKLEFQFRGIFVSNRYALWDMEYDDYVELLEPILLCDADECKCPEGRVDSEGGWIMLRCNLCGSCGRHQLCMKSPSPLYECDVCARIAQAMLE